MCGNQNSLSIKQMQDFNIHDRGFRSDSSAWGPWPAREAPLCRRAGGGRRGPGGCPECGAGLGAATRGGCPGDGRPRRSTSPCTRGRARSVRGALRERGPDGRATQTGRQRASDLEPAGRKKRRGEAAGLRGPGSKHAPLPGSPVPASPAPLTAAPAGPGSPAGGSSGRPWMTSGRSGPRWPWPGSWPAPWLAPLRSAPLGGGEGKAGQGSGAGAARPRPRGCRVGWPGRPQAPAPRGKRPRAPASVLCPS